MVAHKGKAMSDVSFNLEDPTEAYTNPSVHSRISEYTEVARSLHGSDHDPSTQDFHREAVMRAGQGKKHGRFWRLYSLSLPDPSTEHEREPGHSHMADRCTSPGRRTRGYSCFTRHTLIFTHLN